MDNTKERPLILTAQEVSAVLAGGKTQHRSIVVPKVEGVGLRFIDYGKGWRAYETDDSDTTLPSDDLLVKCPFGAVGDRLWVKEQLKHRQPGNVECCMQWAYASDNSWALNSGIPVNADKQKINAGAMPRWASRLLLEITDIRIERVQDINEADAKAMGLKPDYCDHKYQTCEDIGCIGKWAGALFLYLRHEKKLAVHYTDWVWVIEFKVIKPSEVKGG